MARPIELVSRTVAYPQRLTLAIQERACDAKAREASKGIHWAMCEAMSQGFGISMPRLFP
jgi:hypothetical protein